MACDMIWYGSHDASTQKYSKWGIKIYSNPYPRMLPFALTYTRNIKRLSQDDSEIVKEIIISSE